MSGFHGFGRETIDFFLDLRFHNSKAFMDENRERYLAQVRAPFYALIQALAPQMEAIDPDFELRPAKCLSRINRDTRFSRDKSPYRDHLWIAFRQAGRERDGQLFYWFELAPEHMNWGLGVWGENRPAMDAMRRRMAARPEDFMQFLRLAAQRNFSLGGAEWKKLAVPDTLPEELKPWYRKKEIYFGKEGVPLWRMSSPDLAEQVGRDFAALAPLYQALRGCVEAAANQLDEQGGKL